MLAQQLFFTLLLSNLINVSLTFCMEKKESMPAEGHDYKLKEYNKGLRYVAAVEKARQKPHPAYSLKKVTLPEVNDEIQQKIASKILKQKHIMHLATKEIGLETPKMPINYNATITFENNTKFVLYIQDIKLDPKKSIILEKALLKLTNRLSHFEIPIYTADTTQIVAGFGPVFKYEKGTQRLATLEGIRSQMISEIPDYEFYSKLNVLDSESEKESNSIEENNQYHTYVVLSGKKRSDGTLALEAFIGSGVSQYDAAKHAQEQQDIALRPSARQLKEIAIHSVQQSRESIHPSPSITNLKDISYQEQSVVMKDTDETSTVSVKVKNSATSTRINTSNGIAQRPQAQSTTKAKPAFPPAKNESDSKTGSLIYGSLRRAIERTASLTDVRGVKKEHKQPQEMKGNA